MTAAAPVEVGALDERALSTSHEYHRRNGLLIPSNMAVDSAEVELEGGSEPASIEEKHNDPEPPAVSQEAESDSTEPVEQQHPVTAPEPAPALEPASNGQVPALAAPLDTPSWFQSATSWVRIRWDGVVGSCASAAFITGLLGSGLGQLSYWTTKFPFWLAICFALTFELAMVGITRKVRTRRINQLPAGAMHLVGWLAAMGAAGWNVIHLSDPTVVVAFSAVDGGHPLFRGGPVVGTSFGTIAILGFLIHELSERYAVEDALSDQGKKIQRIGVLRLLFYPGPAMRVWKRRIADPSIDVDEEFLRVLADQRGAKVLADIEQPAKDNEPTVPVQRRKSPTAATKAPPRKRDDAELPQLADAVLSKEHATGEQYGFRRIYALGWNLTQFQAREVARMVKDKR